MPKMKTHKGSAKRFRRTGTGKIMRAKAFKSHILTKKSQKRIRGFRKEAELAPADVKVVSQRMGSKNSRGAHASFDCIFKELIRYGTSQARSRRP